MLKTIKSKMVLLQTISILIVLGILFIIFMSSYDKYYFNRKEDLMEEAFKKLENINIERDINNTNFIGTYQELKIKFLITDEKFNVIYATRTYNKTENNKDSKDETKRQYKMTQEDLNKLYGKKVTNRIVTKLDRYSTDFKTRNGDQRVAGRGIIQQNGHKYYVYMYELKVAAKIKMSYFNIFFLFVLIFASLVGFVVAIIVSGKISKPIKQIEENTRDAVKSGYKINIRTNQEFKELTGLAESINTMMEEIRTQFSALEYELERKTKTENLRRQFVNNVSHEMKTPLAIISNQVEMLELLKDEEKKKEYCQSIIEETNNMSEMINDMIFIYSMQSDEETLRVTKADICELVEFTCRDYDKLFDANRIKLHEEYDTNCFAKVNEKFLTQAVSNYISNAVKHSTENGNVYVRVINQEESVRIEVQNEGPNIPENNRNSIWDMFYQGNDNETLNGQKGSGLGLYLVRSIVELHNGKYGYSNLEKGVNFYIEIPKEK